MPPRKSVEDGEVEFHSIRAPLSTPVSFVSPTVLIYVAGNSLCLLNVKDGSHKLLHTSTYGITRLASCPSKGLLAFSEGGIEPHVFVYDTNPLRLLFTIADVTELELADLAFSRCGSRLYALSRATAKRLVAFSMVTGMQLKGCELTMPMRFDKISVFPGHKDKLAVVRISSVRLVSITKSFETYICRLQPPSVPADVDISISAFSWVASGHFLFATRQGSVCTLDGNTGAMMHMCQASQPITSISVTARGQLLTAHIGNQLNIWSLDAAEIAGEPEVRFDMAPPPMDYSTARNKSVFTLKKVMDVSRSFAERQPEERLAGQVAHVQVNPDFHVAALTTAEGEVWTLKTPALTDEVGEESSKDVPVESMQFGLLAWFHTHPISDVLFLGKTPQVCASGDEGGRLRLWEITRGTDPKGFRILRFTSAVTALTADTEGKLIVVGTDSGCVHVVACEDWRQASVVSSLRLCEAGVAHLRSCTHMGRCLMVAVPMFDQKVALFSVMFRDPKVRMFGFLELGPNAIVEDVCFHYHDFKPESVMPSKLAVVGTTTSGASDVTTACLWYFKTPTLDYDPVMSELKRDVCPVMTSKLSASGKLEDRPMAVTSVSKNAFAVGFASGAVSLYGLPAAVGGATSKMAVAGPLESLPGHEQVVTCLRCSPDGAWLVSASMDGTVRRLQMEPTPSVVMQKVVHNPYTGGVSQIAVIEDCKLIASTGGSDGLLVWSDPAVPVKSPQPTPSAIKADGKGEQAVLDVDDRSHTDFPVWTPVSSEEKAAAAAAEAGDDPELSAVAVAQRKALMLEVDGLRKRLHLLVEQNATCPQLEKIDRGEFCVDFEQRTEIATKAKERCDALRAQLDRENMSRRLTRDRLIKEFWDPMRTKGCLVASLMSNLSVANYPERHVSPEEQGTIRKLRIMRQVEHLEAKNFTTHPQMQKDKLLTSSTFTTGEEEYIVNWWSKKTHGKKASGRQDDDKAEKQDDNGDDQKDEEDESEEAEKEKKGGLAKVEAEKPPIDQQYLYEPFELLTNSRRRLQIILLQSLAAEYRAAFNKLFKLGQAEKKDVIEQIQGKVARIRSILAELGIEEDVPEPKMHDLEDPEAVLNVKDSELSAQRFVSEAELKKIAEIEAKEAERLRLLRENDAGTRALMQMMGGTLKTKKDLSPLEMVLDKEPWMDEVAEEDMTELQKSMYTEYLAREKALAEEQDKYKKQLDSELKRLRQEVQDCTLQFEGTLKELHHQRFAADAKFFCQELYCVRLQLALLQNVEDNYVAERTTQELEVAKGKLAGAEDKLEAFNREVMEKKERQEERKNYEKEIGSGQHFKQQFAQSGLEPEQITALLSIFRRKRDQRPSPQVGAASATPSHAQASQSKDPFDAVAVGDPYADMGTETEKTSEREAAEVDLTMDECPDGIDPAQFTRMLELRGERMHAEAEVQKYNAVLQEMYGLQTHLQRESDDARAEYDQLRAELAEHRALMDRELFDVELLFKLRQGQVEVPQAAVVTDYSDAIVIDKEVVEKRNRRILELGKEKVKTLETTMEFRKKLNFILWEHKMLAFKTADLEERTKDVHMLRVTKGLQSLLKGGEEGRNKAEADLLERKIEHLSTNTQQKEGSLRKQYMVGSRATKLRKMENLMLEKKLGELQQNVIQREHIRRLRAPQGGGAGGGGAKEGERPRIVGGGGRIEENEGAIRSAQANFRELRTRQSLMDAVKKNTDEINVLRKEMERLRQKTFPSFVQEERGGPADGL
eukprot:TRINITY_DN12424_c0_g1_i1.p1 TRINITY_DN12424_c0_g1~~TRINITY_DN12424_c0_g1_i1.p1  ORF type:complete len:1741 (-),score=441.52 TRINITY_DN12424_c0_g1_i1:44-5266(-)